MISLRQLSYALAAEKTLHFKKASTLCHVSQSTLSTGLNELEKQLGIQIFERDNKKVLITPLGQAVLDRARSILLQVDELQQLADSQKHPLSFPLTIGVIPTIAPYLLPKLLPTLKQRFPDVRLNIVEEQSHTLVSMLEQGDIDSAILALPYPCPGLLHLEFWQEDFYWVAPKSTKQAQKASVTADELDHSKLMLLKDGHCLREHALDACKIDQQTVNHGFGATSLTTLIQMVLGDLCTTLVPAMALEQLISQNPTLSAVHLREPGPHRRIAFVFRPNFTRTSSIEVLAKIAKETLAQESEANE